MLEGSLAVTVISLIPWHCISLSPASSHVHVGGRDLGSRQQKEALFLQQVRQATEKERANQLRW